MFTQQKTIIRQLAATGLILISSWIAAAQEEGNLQANRVISRSENNKLNLNFPKRVTCEYRENPLGIDSAQPRLSWEIQSKAEGRNLKGESGRLPIRTPLGLIDEGNDTFTLFYTAENKKKFWPVSMIRLKMVKETQ
jgi:hypothetical protein